MGKLCQHLGMAKEELEMLLWAAGLAFLGVSLGCTLMGVTATLSRKRSRIRQDNELGEKERLALCSFPAENFNCGAFFIFFFLRDRLSSYVAISGLP